VGEIYVDVIEAPDLVRAPLNGTEVHGGLVDSSPVATLVYDLRSRVIRYANPALADLVDRPGQLRRQVGSGRLRQPVPAQP